MKLGPEKGAARFGGADGAGRAHWECMAFAACAACSWGLALCWSGCSAGPAGGADADTEVEVEADAGAEADAEFEASSDGDTGVACGNGVLDPGEECDSDPPRACMTSCRSTGGRACIGCRWDNSTCAPPAEVCNGADDNCDGLADEAFGCVQGTAFAACTNACGVAGTAACSDACGLAGPCCASFEACGNGCDDDCDGLADEEDCGIGTPCADDATCAGPDPTCNENWGVCVVPDCTAEPDFAPCEVLTVPDRSYDICVEGTCVSPGCGDRTCNTPGPNWPLADTGQRTCSDDVDLDPIACTGAAGTDGCAATEFCGQDAQYGWDTMHLEAEHFARTEVGSDGVPGEPLVMDNVTGLIWAGCQAGRSGEGCRRGESGWFYWEDALAYCDSLEWGGYDDWRLPDVHELFSLADYRDSTALMLDGDAFPHGAAGLWSSSVRSSASSPFIVWFDGRVGPQIYVFLEHFVRCVRGGRLHERPRSPRFTRTEPVAGYPVVADATTGLVWQGCEAGRSGMDCAGSPSSLSWSEALAYCEGSAWAGFDDWYLPNVKELRSIVDDRRDPPSVDPVAFPAMSVDLFRSATSGVFYVGGSAGSEARSGASCVGLGDGTVAVEGKGRGAGVLCVREGP